MSIDETSGVADLAQDAKNEQKTDSGQTPGAILRQAREEKGWLKEDIAARLNLRTAVLNDIENDNFDAQIGETFFRGYLRAYARVIGLPEQTVLDAFDEMGNADQKPITMQSFSRRTTKESNDTILKGVTWAIAIVMFGSLVFWWWQQEKQQSTPVATAPESSLEATDVAAKNAELKNETTLSEQTVLQLQHPEQDTGLASEDSLLVESGSVSQTAQVSEVEAQASQTESQNMTATQVAAVPEVTTEVAQARPELNILKLSFDGNCWIKVTDSDNQVLAYGEKKQGTELSLNGKQPFTVIMGVPRNVQIEYRGKTVFRNGSEARIVVSS